MPIHMYINSPGGTACLIYTGEICFIEVCMWVCYPVLRVSVLLFAGEAKKRCAKKFLAKLCGTVIKPKSLIPDCTKGRYVYIPCT